MSIILTHIVVGEFRCVYNMLNFYIWTFLSNVVFCISGARTHRSPVDGHRRRRRGGRRGCVSAYAPARSGPPPTGHWTKVLDQYYRVQQHETHSVPANTVTNRRRDDSGKATTRSRRTHDVGELLLKNILIQVNVTSILDFNVFCLLNVVMF